MEIFLYNHNYRYAVEQILLTIFPDERPVYPDAPGDGNRVEIELRRGTNIDDAEDNLTPDNDADVAECRLYIDGELYEGRAEVQISRPAEELEETRQLQRIVKFSFYHAAVACNGVKPVWGALTGIRPGKIATDIMGADDLDSALRAGADREILALDTLADYYDVSPERARLCVDTARASLIVKNSLEPGDIALYIGIPFCPTRCAYCSFVSNSVEKSFGLIAPFLEALFREIEATAEVCERLGLRVIALYIGGGTPTILSHSELDALCTRLGDNFDLSAVREFSVEGGRPETISREKLEVLRKHDVGRFCVNPQTMRDEVLNAIGRRHSAQDVRDAVRLVKETSGFALNMDLIAGLPEDTVGGFRETLEETLAFSPENITVHTLSLKKGSKIMLEGTKLPGAAEVGEMLDIAQRLLSDAGYLPYYLYRQKFTSGGFENVGWSKKGFEGLYNICMMEEHCSILSMGGGASTKLVADTGRIERMFNPKYPLEFIRDIDKIRGEKEKIETFYNALRTK